MEREIKFRVWDNKDKRFVNAKNWLYIDFDEDEDKKEAFINVPDYCIILQFTGLKDKNGKEIYEGDIVNWKDILTGEVKWQQQACQYHINWMDGKISRYHELTANWGAEDYGNDNFEIIGNIYENPELITPPNP